MFLVLFFLSFLLSVHTYLMKMISENGTFRKQWPLKSTSWRLRSLKVPFSGVQHKNGVFNNLHSGEHLMKSFVFGDQFHRSRVDGRPLKSEKEKLRFQAKTDTWEQGQRKPIQTSVFSKFQTSHRKEWQMTQRCAWQRHASYKPFPRCFFLPGLFSAKSLSFFPRVELVTWQLALPLETENDETIHFRNSSPLPSVTRCNQSEQTILFIQPNKYVFPCLSPLTCFPALVAAYMFSRAWHR